jgi:hypothetical protein
LEPVEFHGLADKIPLLGKEVGEVEMKYRKNRRLEEDITFGTLGILRCTVECDYVRSDMKSFRDTGTKRLFWGGGTGGAFGSVAGAAVSFFSDLLLMHQQVWI